MERVPGFPEWASIETPQFNAPTASERVPGFPEWASVAECGCGDAHTFSKKQGCGNCAQAEPNKSPRSVRGMNSAQGTGSLISARPSLSKMQEQLSEMNLVQSVPPSSDFGSGSSGSAAQLREFSKNHAPKPTFYFPQPHALTTEDRVRAVGIGQTTHAGLVPQLESNFWMGAGMLYQAPFTGERVPPAQAQEFIDLRIEVFKQTTSIPGTECIDCQRSHTHRHVRPTNQTALAGLPWYHGMGDRLIDAMQTGSFERNDNLCMLYSLAYWNLHHLRWPYSYYRPWNPDRFTDHEAGELADQIETALTERLRGHGPRVLGQDETISGRYPDGLPSEFTKDLFEIKTIVMKQKYGPFLPEVGGRYRAPPDIIGHGREQWARAGVSPFIANCPSCHTMFIITVLRDSDGASHSMHCFIRCDHFSCETGTGVIVCRDHPRQGGTRLEYRVESNGTVTQISVGADSNQGGLVYSGRITRVIM